MTATPTFRRPRHARPAIIHSEDPMTTDTKPTPVKVRRGLYELRGVTHATAIYRRPNAPVCGGQVFAEWFGPTADGDEVLPASWECYCDRCQECDPNGWPTLLDCVLKAPEYWTDAPAKE